MPETDKEAMDKLAAVYGAWEPPDSTVCEIP